MERMVTVIAQACLSCGLSEVQMPSVLVPGTTAGTLAGTLAGKLVASNLVARHGVLRNTGAGRLARFDLTAGCAR